MNISNQAKRDFIFCSRHAGLTASEPQRASARRDDHHRTTIRPEGCLPQAHILENMYLSLASEHYKLLFLPFLAYFKSFLIFFMKIKNTLMNIKNPSQIYEYDLSPQCTVSHIADKARLMPSFSSIFLYRSQHRMGKNSIINLIGSQCFIFIKKE